MSGKPDVNFAKHTTYLYIYVVLVCLFVAILFGSPSEELAVVETGLLIAIVMMSFLNLGIFSPFLKAKRRIRAITAITLIISVMFLVYVVFGAFGYTW